MMLENKVALVTGGTAGIGQATAIAFAAAGSGLIAASPGTGPYTASKHGVMGLTRSAALDYAKQGIRINAVNPGYIRSTEIVKPQSLQEMGITLEQFESMVSSSVPMGRMGQLEEIAAMVVFLCSDAASYITGQPFAIDGGYTAS